MSSHASDTRCCSWKRRRRKASTPLCRSRELTTACLWRDAWTPKSMKRFATSSWIGWINLRSSKLLEPYAHMYIPILTHTPTCIQILVTIHTLYMRKHPIPLSHPYYFRISFFLLLLLLFFFFDVPYHRTNCETLLHPSMVYYYYYFY